MKTTQSDRILSIDVFRGITMFLLIGEFTHLYSYLVVDQFKGTLIYELGEQLHHHEWNGLLFWDLIQPFFMFIVGLSLPIAVTSRRKKGHDSHRITRHVIKRSIILFLLGWALYCIDPGEITFRFQNVLAQIGVTYLIAYLIMDKSFRYQVIFAFGLLVATDLIYRFFPVDGFNHPFMPNQNFGTWLDLQYGGADLYGHWVSFNAIPTAAHTIWGVLVGKLLMTERSRREKFKWMLIAGAGLIILGYALDPFIPIIKRISTASFVIVSGGWSILVMALFYLVLDMVNRSGRWAMFFQVVGINSLFIYLFTHVGGADFIERILHPFTRFIFGWSDPPLLSILTSIVVWLTLWGLCYWLYRKRIFIKI